MMRARLLRNVGLAAILLCTLASCATVTQEYRDDDAKLVYGIDCSGVTGSLTSCYDKAKSLCPAGYTVIANKAKMPFEPVNINGGLVGIASVDLSTHRGITISCP